MLDYCCYWGFLLNFLMPETSVLLSDYEKFRLEIFASCGKFK